MTDRMIGGLWWRVTEFRDEHSAKKRGIHTGLNTMEALMTVPRLINKNMEVVGSDGAHVGIVDQMEGSDEIKLTKDDADAGGEDHYIPLAWVVHAGIKIHVKLS